MNGLFVYFWCMKQKINAKNDLFYQYLAPGSELNIPWS